MQNKAATEKLCEKVKYWNILPKNCRQKYHNTLRINGPNLLKNFSNLLACTRFARTQLSACLSNNNIFLDKYHMKLKINAERDCKTISFDTWKLSMVDCRADNITAGCMRGGCVYESGVKKDRSHFRRTIDTLRPPCTAFSFAGTGQRARWKITAPDLKPRGGT